MVADPIASALPGEPRRLILIGNPNVGKSVLFGAITGRYATVSNYPGTTVEVTRARAELHGESREVIDTPGTNSLVPQSEDERVARDILLESAGADIVQVGDLKNLRRVLTISLQMAEFGFPFTLCLNMSDEASDHGIEVDTDKLGERLGVEVVSTSALRRWNLERLKRVATRPRRSSWRPRYGAVIESSIERIVTELPELGVDTRGIAIAILSGDETLGDFLHERVAPESLAEIERVRNEAQAAVSDPLAYAISRERLAVVDQLVSEVYRKRTVRESGIRAWLGSMTMHPVWGVPFLLGILLFAYYFVGVFGAGTLVDLVENKIFNAWINPGAIRLLDAVTPFPHTHIVEEGVLSSAYELTAEVSGAGLVAKLFHDILVGPYGVITMALTYAIAIVLPVVATFFVFFGMLEDSGYLPRAGSHAEPRVQTDGTQR
jgi:ferrous iron transport protein B